MVMLMANFTSRLKNLMVNCYTETKYFFSSLYDFGLSNEDTSEREESTYTYLGSLVEDPDAVAGLKSTVASDSLANSHCLARIVDLDCPAMSREATKLPSVNADQHDNIQVK